MRRPRETNDGGGGGVRRSISNVSSLVGCTRKGTRAAVDAHLPTAENLDHPLDQSARIYMRFGRLEQGPEGPAHLGISVGGKTLRPGLHGSRRHRRSCAWGIPGVLLHRFTHRVRASELQGLCHFGIAGKIPDRVRGRFLDWGNLIWEVREGPEAAGRCSAAAGVPTGPSPRFACAWEEDPDLSTFP